MGEFRYKVYAAGTDTAVVFVSGADVLEMNRRFLLAVCAVFLSGGLVVIR